MEDYHHALFIERSVSSIPVGAAINLTRPAKLFPDLHETLYAVAFKAFP